MIDLMKRAAIDAINATNPVNVIFGTVISVKPLKIQVHQKLILTEEFLVMTERATEYKRSIAGENVIIRTGLTNSDKVVLLRVQGGNQFVVLDKVVG